MRSVFSVLVIGFVGFLSTWQVNAQTGIAISTSESVERSVRTVPCENDKRAEAVRELFKQVGATDEQIKNVELNKGKITNIVVRKEGRTKETIIVGAHYDKVGPGCGAIDNWTGISIIAHIFKSLTSIETNRSYIFVAFDKEELGLKGSAAMVKAMSKEEIAATCAMANFDSFGQSVPSVFKNVSSSKLTKLAIDLFADTDLKLKAMQIDYASTDSASFMSKKIPSISLTGLGKDRLSVLHSKKDQLENTNMESVDLGYRVGLILLTKLDTVPCQDLR